MIIKKYLKLKLTILRKNLTTGAMSENDDEVYSTKITNIMKSKVQNFKILKKSGRNSVLGSLQNFSPNTGTCLIEF